MGWDYNSDCVGTDKRDRRLPGLLLEIIAQLTAVRQFRDGFRRLNIIIFT